MPVSINFLSYKEALLSSVSSAVLSSGIALEKIAVVFSSSRATLFFRKILMEAAGQEVLAGPYLYTQEDFITRSLESAGRVFPVDLQRRVMLNRAFLACRKHLTPLFKGAEETFLDDYLAFSSVGDRLLRFYDELMAEQVSFETMKEHAMYTDFEKHITVLQKVWENYRKILHDNSFEERSVFKAEARPAPDFFSQFDYIILVASGILTQSELLILRDISKTVQLDIFVSHEGPLLPQHLKMLNTFSLSTMSTPPQASQLPRISVREFPDAVTQAGFIGEAIQQCRQDGITDDRIAIVLPDESLVGSIIAILGREPFNIAMGLPMGTSPYFSLLKNIQQLFAEKTYAGYNHHSIAAFATHPFIKNIKNTLYGEKPLRIESKKILNKIRDEHRLRLPMSAFGETPGLLSEIKRAEEAFTKPQTLKELASSTLDYLNKLEKLLNADFRQKLYLDRDVRSSREKIMELLAEFTLLGLGEEIRAGAPFTADSTVVRPALLGTLLSMLQAQSYDAVNREGVISVIGLLETRSLQFDAVIIPDLNEGFLPARSRKDLFLNTSIRKSLGLPTLEDREALFGLYLNQILRGAKRAYLACVGSDERGLRSRFLEEILLAAPPASDIQGEREVFRRHIIPGRFQSAPEPGEIKKDKETIATIRNLNHSASSIETYLKCPYRFYLSRVCRIEEPVRIDEELPAWLKGTMFHAAVSEIYRTKEREVLFESSKTHHRILSEAIERQADQYDQIRHVATNRFGLNNWKNRLKKFSENEILLHRDGWRTSETELEIEVVHKSGFRLKGYIDRIDRRGDEIRIIDYKTGAMPKTRKECRLSEGRGVFTRIQLPFYLLLLSLENKIDPEKIEGLYFYDLKKEFRLENRFDDFTESIRSEYLTSFDRFINGIFAEITDPSRLFNHTEDRKNCRYCPFDLICRVSEKGST